MVALRSTAVKIISFENGVPGFFAIAQEARGVIALGQMAVGVVAIGQMAIGCFAVGQLGFGLIGAGQLGIGVYAAGGLGIGGRGKGAILKLVPTVDPPRDLPPTTTYQAVQAGWGDGWVAATLNRNAQGHATLFADGYDLGLKISTSVLAQAYREIDKSPGSAVLAHVRCMGDNTYVCDRLMHVPIPLTAQPNFWTLMIIRMVVLSIVAVAWWLLVVPELTDIFSKVF